MGGYVGEHDLRFDLHPWNLLGVGELEDEFINDAIDPDGAADQLQLGVCRVTEDEAVAVEIAEFVATHAPSELGHTMSAAARAPYLAMGRLFFGSLKLTVGT